MSRSDEFGPLRRRDDEPAFAEPWQAQVLAMADLMVRTGRFAAADWAEALGAELARAEAEGRPDDQATYYAAALAALERLLDRGALATADEVTERRDAWARAYHATPHGRPVALGAERKDATNG